MRELKRNMKVENMRKEFDDFIYYLTELLNHTFSQKGGWFLSDNKFNRLGATIEHENGVRFELYDEEVNNSGDVTIIVEYPNGKSKWLGNFWQKDLTDIADKMYEYAVVKNEIKRKLKENKTMIVLKRSCVQESISGAANDGIADNIDIVIRNEYSLYKGMRAIVDSLVKKVLKGVDLDKDKLAKSSVVDQLVRQAIRYLQKEDHEGDNEGTFDYISTATRNLAKEYVADTILNKVEDDIRYNTEHQ